MNLYSHARDREGAGQPVDDRKDLLRPHRCHTILNRTHTCPKGLNPACPKGLNPAMAIAEIKRMLVQRRL